MCPCFSLSVLLLRKSFCAFEESERGSQVLSVVFLLQEFVFFLIRKQLLFSGKEQNYRNKAKFRHEFSLPPFTDGQKTPAVLEVSTQLNQM